MLRLRAFLVVVQKRKVMHGLALVNQCMDAAQVEAHRSKSQDVCPHRPEGNLGVDLRAVQRS
eukprot:scaffold55684_cov101-Phaeocystis_antarctica.AAC.7